MTVDERRWLQLADAARRVLGDEAGTTLMELLRNHDLERRFEAIEERMSRLEAKLDDINRKLRTTRA
jgi:hypothetical protein